MTRAVLRELVALGIVTAAASVSASARADEQVEPRGVAPLSGAEVTLAETLYREGRKLMAEQRYAEACPKFAESHRLDPATGTLLNLATCLEAQGKLASAWIAFSEAARAARREQREDRLKFADDHIQAIEPRLSRLTVEVKQTPGAGDLKVTVDGFRIGPAAYGVAAPIDPGTHRIEVSAPGFKKWSAELVVGGSADHGVVTVPPLEAEPVPVVPAARAPQIAPRPIEPSPLVMDSEAPRPIPTVVYVTGAATLMLVGAAVVTGLVYLDRKSDYSAIREEGSAPRDQQMNARDDAKVFGWLNLGFTAGALIGAGATALLYTTRPGESAAGSAGPRITAWVLPHQGGLALTSEF